MHEKFMNRPVRVRRGKKPASGNELILIEFKNRKFRADYNIIMYKLLIFLFLAVGLATAANYQERGIYYDEKDFACLHREILDFVIVNVAVDGKEYLRKKYWNWLAQPA